MRKFIFLLMCTAIATCSVHAQTVSSCADSSILYNTYNYSQNIFGKACWMTENLRTTKYATGDSIPFAKPYNEDASYLEEFGLLYSWYSAVKVAEGDDSATPSVDAFNRVQGVCPDGWVLPTQADYLTVIGIVGDATDALDDSSRYWLGTGIGASPAEGLNFLPGGFYNQTNHRYENILGNAYYWTSGTSTTTIAQACSFLYGCRELITKDFGKGSGFSVRCICILPEMNTLAFDNVEPTSVDLIVPLIDNGAILPNAEVSLYLNSDFSDATPISQTNALVIGNNTFSFADLVQNTTYFVKVTATNSCGQTTITDSITTPCKPIPVTACTVAGLYAGNESGTGTTLDSVADHQGNYYDVVQIGNQCWLKENMRATTSPLTGNTIVTGTMYQSCTGKSAGFYKNDAATYGKYGVLYNWCAATDTFRSGYAEVATSTNTSDYWNCTFTGNRRGICPEGWHLPSDAEWTTMEEAAGIGDAATLAGTNWRGDSAVVLAGGCDWNNGGSATNRPGNYSHSRRNATLFSAAPGGGYGGSFGTAGDDAYFWSATQYDSDLAYYRNLYYCYVGVNRNCSTKGSGFSVRCLRDVLTLGDAVIDNITPTTMDVTVPILATGGETPTAATICAYTDSACTSCSICVSAPAITATQITGKLFGLIPNTTYYIKATAENSITNDSAYAKARTALTTCTVAARNTTVENGQSTTSIDSVKDHEGNWYDVVQIGNQCWLKENMRCKTSPRQGTGTGQVNLTEGTTTSYNTPYYYTYNKSPYTDTTSNIAKWGRLYNWCAAIDTNVQSPTLTFPRRGICPEGWHLPTDAEWTTMEVAAGIGDAAALAVTGWRGDSAVVLAGGCDWNNEGSATNRPGNYSHSRRNATLFSAAPGGLYYGSFNLAGYNAYFWSATQYRSNYAYYRNLYYDYAGVYRYLNLKTNGFSVRCVRD